MKLYTQWIQENGVIHPVTTEARETEIEGCLGLYATADIPNYTAFMFIPNRLLITVPKVRASPIGHIILENPQLFD